MGMQTVITDAPDQSAESHAIANAGDTRAALGAALFRMSGEQPPDVAPSHVDRDDDRDDDEGNAAQDALTPDASADDAEPTSRRGKATIRELRDEVERLKAQVAAPRDDPKADTTPEPKRSDAARQVLADLLGDDAEFDAMERTVVSEGLYALDNEARYREMKLGRMFRDKFDAYADAVAGERGDEYRASFFTGLAAHFDAVAGKAGIDAAFIRETPDLGKVFDHIYEAGRKDLADENERLKGELAEAKARLAGATPRLPTGGRSSITAAGAPDARTADPRELMTAGMRQRSKGRR